MPAENGRLSILFAFLAGSRRSAARFSILGVFPVSSKKQKVAILTAGGLAPCLSSAVGGLIGRYSELAPELEIIGYLGGYKGLLLGSSVPVTPEVRAGAHVLHKHGGSPIGNSRVKLTNA